MEKVYILEIFWNSWGEMGTDKSWVFEETPTLAEDILKILKPEFKYATNEHVKKLFRGEQVKIIKNTLFRLLSGIKIEEKIYLPYNLLFTPTN